MRNRTLPKSSLLCLISALIAFWCGRLYEKRVSPESLLQGNDSASKDFAPGLATRGAITDSVDETSEAAIPDLITNISGLLKGGLTRQSTMDDVQRRLDDLSSNELVEALDFVERSYKGVMRERLLSALLTSLVQHDGPRAIEYALGEASGNRSIHLVPGLLFRWAEHDAEAAFAWQKENGDNAIYSTYDHSYLASIFAEFGKADVQKAFEKLHSLKETEGRRFALSGLLSGAADPELRGPILEQLSVLADPSLREYAYNMLFTYWAYESPEEATRFIEEMTEYEEDTRTEWTNAVVDTWMHNDPEDAAAWLIGSETKGDQSEKLHKIVSNWVYRDPNAAAEWMTQFPPSSETDHAMQALATGITRFDPESGFEWAALIIHEEQRLDSLHAAFDQWHRQNAAVAEQRLRESGIADEHQDHWIDEARNRPLSGGRLSTIIYR